VTVPADRQIPWEPLALFGFSNIGTDKLADFITAVPKKLGSRQRCRQSPGGPASRSSSSWNPPGSKLPGRVAGFVPGGLQAAGACQREGVRALADGRLQESGRSGGPRGGGPRGSKRRPACGRSRDSLYSGPMKQAAAVPLYEPVQLEPPPPRAPPVT